MGIGLGIGINRSNYAQGIFNAYQSRVTADGGITEAGNCVNAVSSLLQSASLLIIPSGYKGGKAYAEIPTNGNGDLTWTRASTALRTNSSGLLESMGSGVPRLSYMYGSCPALLLEPQRTNLCLQSNDIGVTNWVKSQVTATSNQTTSPDGTTNAGLLSVGVDASAVRHRLYGNPSPSYTSGTTYTWSIYAKKNAHDWMQMLFQTTAFDAGAWANFDLNNGVVGNTGGSVVTARIQPVGNGWYRCSITSTAITTATAPTEVLVINNINSGRYPSYQSLSAQDVYYLWGAQVEVGAYPTTLIVTTTATETRLADTFTRNNIYTNGLISASGGTWFVELRGNLSLVRDAGVNFGLGIGDSASTNAINIWNVAVAPTATRLQIRKNIASGGSATIYTTTADTVKLAIKWNGTSIDVFENGTKVVSASAFTITNMDFLRCSSEDRPRFIQAMALYPTPLSDTDCTTLTTL